VVNRHTAPTLPSAWWSVAFAAAVRDMGHTVLLLQPWNAPVALSRSWCLVRPDAARRARRR
jgi:hypothetical protein